VDLYLSSGRDLQPIRQTQTGCPVRHHRPDDVEIDTVVAILACPAGVPNLHDRSAPASDDCKTSDGRSEWTSPLHAPGPVL